MKPITANSFMVWDHWHKDEKRLKITKGSGAKRMKIKERKKEVVI